jgi:hypothetical protein
MTWSGTTHLSIPVASVSQRAGRLHQVAGDALDLAGQATQLFTRAPNVDNRAGVYCGCKPVSSIQVRDLFAVRTGSSLESDPGRGSRMHDLVGYAALLISSGKVLVGRSRHRRNGVGWWLFQLTSVRGHAVRRDELSIPSSGVDIPVIVNTQCRSLK